MSNNIFKQSLKGGENIKMPSLPKMFSQQSKSQTTGFHNVSYTSARAHAHTQTEVGVKLFKLNEGLMIDWE